MGKLKDRHLEQAVKYSRALEEQGKASTRERDLLRQVGRLATPGAKNKTWLENSVAGLQLRTRRTNSCTQLLRRNGASLDETLPFYHLDCCGVPLQLQQQRL